MRVEVMRNWRGTTRALRSTFSKADTASSPSPEQAGARIFILLQRHQR